MTHWNEMEAGHISTDAEVQNVESLDDGGHIQVNDDATDSRSLCDAESDVEPQMAIETSSTNAVPDDEEEATSEEEDNTNEHLLYDTFSSDEISIADLSTNSESNEEEEQEEEEDTSTDWNLLHTRLCHLFLAFLSSILKIVIITFLAPGVYIFVTISVISFYFQPSLRKEFGFDIGWDHRTIHFRILFAFALFVFYIIVTIFLLTSFLTCVLRELTGWNSWSFQEYNDWFLQLIRLCLYPELPDGSRPKIVSPLPS